MLMQHMLVKLRHIQKVEPGRFLVQPRTRWDTIYSCVYSITSLFFNQSLDEYVTKGIIKPSILQSRVLMLALHHDLTSDLLKERGGDFDVEEFMVGAEPAIMSFTEKLHSLDTEITAFVRDQLKLLKKEEDSEEKSERNNEQENDVPTIDTEKTIIQKVSESNFSLSEELSNMMSSQLFNSYELFFTANVLLSNISGAPTKTHVPGSCTIIHVSKKCSMV